MFTRPAGFSSSFEVKAFQAHAEKQALVLQEKERAYQARTVFSEIDDLCEDSDNKADVKQLKDIALICQESIQFINEYKIDAEPGQLKFEIKNKIAKTSGIIKELVGTILDRDTKIIATNQLRPLYQKQADHFYYSLLQQLVAKDEEDFEKFLSMRKDPKITSAKEQTLQEIKTLLVNKKRLPLYPKVLLCISLTDFYLGWTKTLEEHWTSDIILDLQSLGIRSQCLYQERTSRFVTDPDVVVTIGTDEIDAYGTTQDQINCLWDSALRNAFKSKKPVIPVRLGSNLKLWPKGLDYLEPDEQIAQFPIQKKGYFTVLFEIVKAFLEQEDHEEFSAIITNFNNKLKE